MIANEGINILAFDIPIFVPDLIDLLAHVLVFILLLLAIRYLRPDISRYPYGFAYLPGIIMLVYPLIDKSEAITIIIYMMMQAGSILVFTFLIVGHYDQIKRGWMGIIAITSFLAAYLIFWILPSAFEIQVWYWKPFLAIGMLSASLSFPYVLNDHRNIPDQA